MAYSQCVLVFLLIFTTISHVTVAQTFQYEQESERLLTAGNRTRGIRDFVNKDFVLAGLFAVHEDAAGVVCGMAARDQWVEAMLFAIDSVNSNGTLLPNITLGFDIRDSCYSENIGLEEAIDVINGSQDASIPTVGIVGAAASRVSIPVAGLGSLFQVPQVSFASTSPILSNRTRFPYFYRTVPPDNFQTQAMIDLIRYFNWTQVSIIYVGDSYGQPGGQELQRLAMDNDICIDVYEEIGLNFGSEDYRVLAEQLLNSDPDIVILFSHGHNARGLLEEVAKSSPYHRFTWIASDAWARSLNIAHMFNETVAGYFGVTPRAPYVPSFDEYLSQLTIRTNRRNHWFEEIIAAFTSCNNSNPCNQNTSLTSLPNYAQGSFVSPMIDAVYAFANALHNFLEENCNFTSGWTWANQSCPGQKRGLNGSTLLIYLRRVDFINPLTGNRVTFDSSGSAAGSYDILNYQAQISNDVTKYGYQQVGTWSSSSVNSEPSLNLWENITLQFGLNRSTGIVYQPPITQCIPCSEGEIYTPVTSSCCGSCEPATDRPVTSDLPATSNLPTSNQPATCSFAVHVIGIACIIAYAVTCSKQEFLTAIILLEMIVTEFAILLMILGQNVFMGTVASFTKFRLFEVLEYMGVKKHVKGKCDETLYCSSLIVHGVLRHTNACVACHLPSQFIVKGCKTLSFVIS